MKNLSSKRGSALLIVLGMLSFVVVSAVAFATYMRYARLPSSYLRRTSASRLLVKAALAEAIEMIDASIGNNPYPGVGDKPFAYPRGVDSQGETINRNWWRDRVFVGTNEEIEPLETVATLNMEALAYVPPPFINDIRYWSRRSLTATWQTMSFDAGRYAFTALDVSDCFDVNRLQAGAGRDSSDLGRISLAHCFENADHTDYVIDPTQWDQFMANYIDPSGVKVPLVSVADLNLAIADKRPRNIESPFVKYVQTTGGNAKFVTDNTDGDPKVEMLRNMCFVTDSYVVADTNDTDLIDITLAENQPFDGLTAGKASSDKEDANEDDVDKILQNKSNFISDLSGYISPFAMIQLYDYLDRDSVPVSLAFPTVERTPMVTGVAVQPLGPVFAKVTPQAPVVLTSEKDPMSGQTTPKTRARVATLELSGKLGIVTGLVYPFKYDRGKHPTFKVQAGATIAFVPQGSANSSLRLPNAKKPAVFPTIKDWNNSKQVKIEKFAGEAIGPVLTLFSEQKTITYPKNVTEESQAVLNDIALQLDINEVFKTDISVPDGPAQNGTFCVIETLDKEGKVVGTDWQYTPFVAANAALNGTVKFDTAETYVPVMQVWVRVVDDKGHTVDLVPACTADDEKPSKMLGQVATSSGTRGALRFSLNSSETPGLKVDDAFMTAAQPLMMNVDSVAPAAYMADDPRFNYAPENLIKLDTMPGAFQQAWLAQQRSENRDGDIFMTTSDAGYLQSAWELTNLISLDGTGKFVSQAKAGALNGADGSPRTDFASTPANAAMWRSCASSAAYDQIKEDLLITSGTKGFRINPNTRDINILMSALANAPMDWWAASTNDVNDSVKKSIITKSKTDKNRNILDFDKSLDYTFSEMGASAPMKHGKRKNGVAEDKSLMKLAEKLMTEFANAGRSGREWDEAFDNLDWDSPDRIAGVDFDIPLHAVDRRFLHGFWRECFDNRQQLFLVFVRAEPMMMGGGGLGQTPPQLGARAVALVWRDPKATKADVGGQPRPHRMRVLFYRQLD